MSKHKHMGGAKGIQIIDDYLRERGYLYDEIAADNRSDYLLRRKLKNVDLSKYTHIISHYPIYIFSYRYIKKNYPNIILIIRSHNAEFPHWMEHAFVWLKYFNIKKSIKTFFVAWYKLFGDYFSAKQADYILSITLKESKWYWEKLTKKEKIIYAPYFIPEKYVIDTNNTIKNKKDICVCIMSSGDSSFLKDASHNFSHMVEKSGNNLAGWKFFVTGHEKNVDKNISEKIIRTGFVDNLNILLSESKAIVILSDYGYGFKTKILEAIQCNCYTLVTKKLLEKLPDEVKPYCIVVDLKSVKSYINALEQCNKKFPPGNPNNLLKEISFNALDLVLKINK